MGHYNNIKYVLPSFSADRAPCSVESCSQTHSSFVENCEFHCCVDVALAQAPTCSLTGAVTEY